MLPHTYPLVLPGCHCMTGGKVCWPFFSVEAGSSMNVGAYTELMSYIPAPPKASHTRPTERLGYANDSSSASRPNSCRAVADDMLLTPTASDEHPFGWHTTSTGTGTAVGPNSAHLFSGRKQHEDTPALDGQDCRRKQHTAEAQSTYTTREKRLVLRYLKEEIDKGNRTEKKWKTVAIKLNAHGCRRSQWSIKSWWSRYGREESGFDERKNPNGRPLVTSKQSSEARKRARDRMKVLRDELVRSEGHTTRAK
ncbi:MAG: hypothetical protein Q9220_007646 [cf. Caloplaca sp. 1 TL-2023]